MNLQKAAVRTQQLSEMNTEAMRTLVYSVPDEEGRMWTVIYYIEQGRITGVLTEQQNAVHVGDIWLGRIVQNARSIGASFADTEGGRFFLPGIHKIGSMLPIRVETLPFREKLAKATLKLSMKGSYTVVSCEGMGFTYSKKLDAQQKQRLQELAGTEAVQSIAKGGDYRILFRTNAGETEPEEIVKELQALDESLAGVRKKAEEEQRCTRLYTADSVLFESVRKTVRDGGIWITASEELYREALEVAAKLGADASSIRFYEDTSISMSALYGMQNKLKRILSERVWLDSGAEIVITEAEAMCVIDVNSARIQTANGKSREEVFLKLNLEAAREIRDQILARNISGTILIDFVSMESKESETILLSEMRNLCKGLFPPIKVVDITKLGIMETTRQRLEGSIREKRDLLNKTILI